MHLQAVQLRSLVGLLSSLPYADLQGIVFRMVVVVAAPRLALALALTSKVGSGTSILSMQPAMARNGLASDSGQSVGPRATSAEGFHDPCPPKTIRRIPTVVG
jgi:hypothetical protein